MGAAAPLTAPICTFKLYKINSHKSKLKIVRAELAKRRLSPADKRKRDVLVPVTIACAVYVAAFGLADIIDIVPSDLQGMFEGHIESATNLEQGSVGEDKVGNKYEAFIIAEAATPIINSAIHPSPSGQR